MSRFARMIHESVTDHFIFRKFVWQNCAFITLLNCYDQIFIDFLRISLDFLVAQFAGPPVEIGVQFCCFD